MSEPSLSRLEESTAPWLLIDDLTHLLIHTVRFLVDELKDTSSKCLVEWQITFAPGDAVPNLILPRLMTTLGAKVYNLNDENRVSASSILRYSTKNSRGLIA